METLIQIGIILLIILAIVLAIFLTMWLIRDFKEDYECGLTAIDAVMYLIFFIANLIVWLGVAGCIYLYSIKY